MGKNFGFPQLGRIRFGQPISETIFQNGKGQTTLAGVKPLLLPAIIGFICSCSSAEDELAEKGGYSLLLNVEGRVDDGDNKIPVAEEEVEQAVRAIRGRLEGMGIAKVLVTQEGVGSILLKVPGVDGGEAQRIAAMLEKTSRLGLFAVSPRSDETNAEGITLARRVQDGDEIVPGFRAHTHKARDVEGNVYETPILISRRMAVGGEDIAMAVLSHTQPDAVDIALNGKGTDKMIAFTKDMRPGLDRIAIMLDGEVITAPVVQSVPLGKHFNITGLDKPGEAQALAITLMHPLGNPLKVVKIRQIPPGGN